MPRLGRSELQAMIFVLAAAEWGSFRKAAASLSIDPSVISKRIRDFEARFETQLFTRYNGGVRPTDAGSRLIARAGPAFEQINGTLGDLEIGRRAKRGGVLRVGFCTSLASGFLAELVHRLSRQREWPRTDYFEGSPSDHLAALREERLDIAFLPGTTAITGCCVEHLWNEQLFVTMSTQDPLVSHAELMWSDLHNRTFTFSEKQPGADFHCCLLRSRVTRGLPVFVHTVPVFREALLQLVAIEGNLTLGSEGTATFANADVTSRPLIGEVLPLSAVWSQWNGSSMLRRFVDLARSISPLTAGGSMRKPVASAAPALQRKSTDDVRS
ncbi:DNA-binding transcriptional LysR family regulator [Bradyrhizobium sp. USDA 4501]